MSSIQKTIDSGFCLRSCLALQKERGCPSLRPPLPPSWTRLSKVIHDLLVPDLMGSFLAYSLPHCGNQHFCPCHPPLAILFLCLAFFLRLPHALFSQPTSTSQGFALAFFFFSFSCSSDSIWRIFLDYMSLITTHVLVPHKHLLFLLNVFPDVDITYSITNWRSFSGCPAGMPDSTSSWMTCSSPVLPILADNTAIYPAS